jgi:hypothetical protein
MAVKYTDNGVAYSDKTKDLRSTLDSINISNLQAMKLLSDAYSVKAQLGRKKGGRQSGGRVGASLASLGSGVSLPKLTKKHITD